MSVCFLEFLNFQNRRKPFYSVMVYCIALVEKANKASYSHCSVISFFSFCFFSNKLLALSKVSPYVSFH